MNTAFNATSQVMATAQTSNSSLDLSQESADALIKSMKEVVRDSTGLEIQVEREMWLARGKSLSMFVVTLPAEVTPEQRAEADYWLNEIGPLFRYA